ncbi:MAG: hypothetical protein A2Y33_15070 [Spirochaetes bacterium GWF1_51_8]|nr:MAG: hypothetical protein A2Y33_15070 [Spirochaetes bacterium GWF1_51_8]
MPVSAFRKYSAIVFAACLMFVTASCQLATGGGFSEIPKTKTTKLDKLKSFFDLTDVPSIVIEISSNEWNTLLTNFDVNDRNETMVKADFSFVKDGVTNHYINIGFRVRGNSFSRVRPEGSTGQMHQPSGADWHQAHFKIDIDQFAAVNTNFYGMDGINLKFINSDPAYAREVYCYNLFQKFGVWTAPLASFCKVYIKIKEDPTAAYFGVYTMIEPIDDNFLKVRFTKTPTDDEGNLWKCLYQSMGPADMLLPADAKIGIESIDQFNEGNSIRPSYDLKTQKTNFTAAKAQLLSFINNLNTKTGADFESWISQAMDVDLLLRAYAVNVLVGMWDDYWKNGNNYYFYFDDLGKAYFIPYDYDNTMGTSGTTWGDPGTENVLNWGDDTAVLIEKVLAIPAFQNTYKKYIAELINKTNDLFDFTKSTNRIKQMHSVISPFIANDTGDNMSIVDQPGWGDYMFYSLLTGAVGTNYFKTRIVYAQLQLGLPTNGNTWGSGGGGGGGDTTPPTFTDPPTFWANGTDWIEFYWRLNEAGTVYFVCLTNNSAAPTSAEVKLGQSAGGGAPIGSGSVACPSITYYGWGVGGLTYETPYDIYCVAQDTAVNLQSSPTLLNATTGPGGYISPEILPTSIIFRFKYTGASMPSTNIYLRGDPANGDWDNGLLMTYVGGGLFEITRLRPSQADHGDAYKFWYNNGAQVWLTDPVNTNYVDDGWGGYNSLVVTNL